MNSYYWEKAMAEIARHRDKCPFPPRPVPVTASEATVMNHTSQRQRQWRLLPKAGTFQIRHLRIHSPPQYHTRATEWNVQVGTAGVHTLTRSHALTRSQHVRTHGTHAHLTPHSSLSFPQHTHMAPYTTHDGVFIFFVFFSLLICRCTCG
jgi:hypothetical protein